MSNIAVPAELEAVLSGDKMSCFGLLASGIASGWLPQVTTIEDCPLPASIPRRISQFWHADSLPDDVKHAVNSVSVHNQNFDHIIMNDESARQFIIDKFGIEVSSLFERCFHPAMRSDFWRICDIYEYGGIYVDVDTMAYSPVDKVSGGTNFDCFLTYSIGSPWCIDNDFIVAKPRHPLIQKIMEGIFANVSRFIKTGHFENIWVETGPGITTMATARWLAEKQGKEGIDPSCTGLMFRHHDGVADAFQPIAPAYKQTAEGNWRGAAPPIV